MSFIPKLALVNDGFLGELDVTGSDTLEISLVDTAYSFSFWLKVIDYDTTFRGVLSWDHANHGYNFFISKTGSNSRLSFYMRHTTGWYIVHYTPVTNPNDWHHIYCECTTDNGTPPSGTMTMYVDNVSKGTAAILKDVKYFGSIKFHVGRYWDGLACAHIADMAIWDNTISAAERAQLQVRRQGMPLMIAPGNLLAYWPLMRWPHGHQMDDSDDWFMDHWKNQLHLEIFEETDARAPSSIGTGEGGERILSHIRSPLYVARNPAAVAATLRALGLMQVGQ